MERAAAQRRAFQVRIELVSCACSARPARRLGAAFFTSRLDSARARAGGEAMSSTIAIDHSQIHQRAYARWQERGCPVGSPDHDWFEAEQELVRERTALEAASAK